MVFQRAITLLKNFKDTNQRESCGDGRADEVCVGGGIGSRS